MKETNEKSKFTEEQIVRILQEAADGKKTHAELCKEHGVNLNTFYIGRRKYAGLKTHDVKRMKHLERENDELKKLVAKRELEISAVRKLFRKVVMKWGPVKNMHCLVRHH